MVKKNHSEADAVLFERVARFYSGNDVLQIVPLSSLMINLPVTFTRGNFDYFLGRFYGVFYEEASALQLFVLTILLLY